MRRSLPLTLTASLTLAVAHAAPLVFETERHSTPTDAWIADRDTADHWNLWSTDKNAKNWSGGVILRSPTVDRDRTDPAQGAPALHTRLTGIPPGIYHVEVKPGGRPLGLSFDGKKWFPFKGGFIARDREIRDGTFELWADDRFACDPEKNRGPAYYDTIVLHPKVACSNGIPNPGFELADDRSMPAGWSFSSGGTTPATPSLSPAARTGKRALRVAAGDNSRWSLAATERLAVKPGQEYRLVAWVKASGTNSIRMSLAGFDADGQSVARAGRAEIAGPREGWTRLRGFALIPDGISEVATVLDGGGAGETIIDDLSIERFEFQAPDLPRVIGHAKQRVEERLDRAPVALPAPDGHHISWRLLRDDPPDLAFHVYRQIGDAKPERVTPEPVRWTTDFRDRHAATIAPPRYLIRTVRDGEESHHADTATPAQPGTNDEPPHVSIPLRQPDATFQKIGVADLDGDSHLDAVIKLPNSNIDPASSYWHPSPGTYKLEAYRHDGAALWQFDLGYAVEQGIWYSPYLAHDLDGDGRAEVAAKIGDGDPRDPDGRVTSGPEWLVVIDGVTGKERARTPWIPRDGFENYNLASRNQIAVAYLDGKTPCLIALRGTYGLMRAAAYEFHQGRLRQLWTYDNSEFGPRFWGQGAHTTHAADIDGDGRDEVILGSAVLDDNGAPLWSTGLGHPDHSYVTDAIPSRPGLEIYYGIETAKPKNTMCMVDAATGRILWGWDQPTKHVHSTGLCSDIDPLHPGAETYGADSVAHKPTGDRWFWSAQGDILSRERDFGFGVRSAFWDADLQREILHQDGIRDLDGAPHHRLPKGAIALVADLLGDWREEIVVSAPGELRIYSTPIPATDRRVTFLQDPIYRLDVTLTAMGYTQVPSLRSLPEATAPGLNLTALEPGGERTRCRATLSAPLDRPLRGTLRLSASSATVAPATFPVDVAPGRRASFECEVRPQGDPQAKITLDATLDGAPTPLRASTPIPNRKGKESRRR